MFEAIRSFVADLASGDKQGSDFDDDDYRVAYAALPVPAASIDGNFSKAERDKLDALLKQRFDLDDAESGRLIEQASVADLLGVPSRERVALRQRVKAARGSTLA